MMPISRTAPPLTRKNSGNTRAHSPNLAVVQELLTGQSSYVGNTAHASLISASPPISSVLDQQSMVLPERLSGLRVLEPLPVGVTVDSLSTREAVYLQKLHTWKVAILGEASVEERIVIREAVRRIEEWVCNQQSSTRLMLDHLGLKVLPELPDWVINLSIKGNALQTLPGLPSALEDLDVSDNKLNCLPPLPWKLNALDANDNCLTVLPALPMRLEVLGVRNNRLRCLPQKIPLTLNVLLLEGNPLTSLPERITDLPASANIHLGHIPLPISVWQRLERIVHALGYKGPCFYFSREISLDELLHPLHIAVAYWYPIDAQISITETWAVLQSTLGATDFSRFLDRLRDSIHFQHAEFKEAIRNWLDRLSVDSELRELTFAIAQEGIGFCEDRATLTLNVMQQAQKNLEVERGRYDDHLDELIMIGRTMFRLKELERIARDKAASMRLVDEIEVYLAYQVKLHIALALPMIASDMRFFDVSYVTQDDLDAALLLVQQREASDFFSFLANDWAPWQAVLKRLDPQAYQAAQEQLNVNVDEEFFAKQTEYLQKSRLPNTEYQLMQTAPAVLRAMADEIMGELTQRFLSERNLSL